jgi:serine/threonine protein kinase
MVSNKGKTYAGMPRRTTYSVTKGGKLPYRQDLPALLSEIDREIEAILREQASQPISTVKGPDHSVDRSISNDARSAFLDLDHSPESVSRPLHGRSNSSRSLHTHTVLNHRYEIIECIGSGGACSVYKARDMGAEPSGPAFVAIKVLNHRYRTAPDWLASLKREVVLRQALEHPNIVRIIGLERDSATVYLLMEYLSGNPLTRLIRGTPARGLPQSRGLEIIRAIGAALSHLHAQGVIHRDVKPANIFITSEGIPKLIDFGTAQPLPTQEAHNSEKIAPASTRTGLLAVSPAYTCPEVLMYEPPDPRDDVFSLACTTYEILTGHHPFDYRPAFQARDLGLRVPQRPGLTAAQFDAVTAALAFWRWQRTPDIRQFISDLVGDNH